MQLTDVMRTTHAAREYTDETVSDETLYRILEQARFAPSGGNRQGWRVLIVKETALRVALKQLMQPAIKQYLAQSMAGEVPFNTINPSNVDERTIANMPPRFPLIDQLESVPVLLVVCVDLSLVTSFDRDLSRVGVISGASIYPFVWNILLAARNEGLGGVLTTFLGNAEKPAKELLKLPPSYAIASMVALGKPVKQLTRLKRNPVETFARIDTWQGNAFSSNS